MKVWKSISSIIFFFISMAVCYSHYINSMFPAIPLAILAIAIGGVLLAIKTNSYKMALLSVFTIVIATVSLRWFIYIFPASYIGVDPDTMVRWANSIIQTGRTSAIDSNFYSNAPGGLILPSVISLVSGVHVRYGMSVYAPLFGVLFPLLAVTIVNRIHPPRPRVMIGAAVIGATLTESIRRGYWPIAHNLAILLFQVFVLSLVISSRDKSMNSTFVTLFISPMLLYSHKIPLVLTIAVLIVTIVYVNIEYDMRRVLLDLSRRGISPRQILIIASIFSTGVWGVVVWLLATAEIAVIGVILSVSLISILVFTTTPQTNSYSDTFPESRQFTILLIILTCMFAIQWTIVTTQFTYILRLIQGTQSTLPVSQTTYTFTKPLVESATYDVLNIFFHRSHSLILVLTSAIVLPWLVVANQGGGTVPFATVAVMLIITPLSIVSDFGLTSSRLLPNFSAIAAGVLSVGFFHRSISKKLIRVSAVLIIILLVFQAFSVTVVPDYPGTQRYYLFEEEISAKEFGNKYVQGDVYTDNWYASESIDDLPGTPPESSASFRGVTGYYYNGTLGKSGFTNILYRTEENIYDERILTWDPEPSLDETHSVTYENGKTKLYTEM